VGLETPIIQNEDSIFPGENWFFYWKTSASLWESKLRERFVGESIVIPINWAFHSETGESVDFGGIRPETDLKRLTNVIEEQGKKAIFYLPIGPAPYLPNGGFPTVLSRIHLINREKMVPAVIDFEGQLNKFFSPFDPRVYKAFGKFVYKLGEYLGQNGIYSPLWAVNCGYFQKEKFYSYFEDFSKGLEPGFEQYLEEIGENNLSPIKEFDLKKRFQNIIFNSYRDISKRYLSKNWEGVIKVAFLGGAPQDFFQRICLQEKVSTYSQTVLKTLGKGILPSSCLISEKIKRGVLSRQLGDLNLDGFLDMMKGDFEDFSDSRKRFNTLAFFDLVEPLDSLDQPCYWEQSGLLNFLSSRYQSGYRFHSLNDYSWNEEFSSNLIHFFYGKDLKTKELFSILNIFMNGGKVVLDVSGLDKKLLQRLNVFILENNFTTEKIHYLIKLECLSLGEEGRLIILNGDEIDCKQYNKVFNLWEKIIQTFDIRHLEFQCSEGVEYYWRSRASHYNELNFEEVRRLSLYNPTSYKRKIKLELNKNFALMKILDEVHVKTNVLNSELFIEILPEGSLSLDFGVYS